MEYNKKDSWEKMRNFLKKNRNMAGILFYFLVIFYVVWAIPYINKGVDITDVGYYLTKYRYIFDSDINVRAGSILLTEIVGGFIYRFTTDYQMLIVNIAGWLCYFVSGILVYNTVKREKRDAVALLMVIVGMMYSLSWIRSFNYNSLSMLIQIIIIVLLLNAIKSDKNIYIIISGILLGINVFVRFPNALQGVLGLLLFWNYGIKKSDWKQALKKFAIFFTGALAGGLAAAGIACYFLGFQGVIDSFFEILKETSQTSSGHGLNNMLQRVYDGLELGVQMWIVKLLILTAILFVFFTFSKHKSERIKKWGFCFLYILAGVLAIRWGWGFQEAHVMYEMMASFFIISSFFLMLTPKLNCFQSTMAFVILVSEVVLTIGTDNGWYYQSVFVIFPLSAVTLLWYCYWNVCKEKQYIRIMVCFMLLVITSFGVKYMTTNVYRDSAYEELVAEADISVLKGMKTTPEKAAALEELQRELCALEDEYSTMAVLGDCPIAYTFTELEPCFSNPWPDLQSFRFEKFQEEIDMKISKKEYPVILFANFDQDNYEMMDMEKKAYLQNIVDENEYKIQYESKNFKIYVRDIEKIS